MSYSRHLVTALMLAASAACSSKLDLTDPVVIATELRGTWSRTFDAPGNSTVWQLSVRDSTITGSGTFAGEAGPSGTLSVAGQIVTGQHSGPLVQIDFAQDNGPVGHFTGTLTGAETLYGSVWYSATGLGIGDPVVATFRRTSH